MSTLKLRTLMGASALVMSATAALAQTAPAVTIAGGGSSLIAPYAREAADCFGQHATNLYAKGTAPLATIPYVKFFNYAGAVPQDCNTTSKDGTVLINYLSTGSGSGIKALYQHDLGAYGTLPSDGQSYATGPHYAFSDTALGTADVGVYNNGGSTAAGQTVNLAAPGVAPTSGQFANPRTAYGPLVQFPALIAPVTIAYSSVYKKVRNADGSVTSYRFNTKYKRAADTTDTGGLRLDQATYCAIFNGQITDWNDSRIQVLNQIKTTVRTTVTDPVTHRTTTVVTHPYLTLKDPNDPTTDASWSVPLQIVGRSDSSGTTSLFTRHLAAVCGDSTRYTGSNAYADSTTTLPSTLRTANATYNKANANTVAVSGETLGQFTLAAGNDGVAQYAGFTADPGPNAGDSTTAGAGRIAYVGPDYVHGVTDNYNLVTASLKNLVAGATTFVAPTATAAAKAFGTSLPPQTTSTGVYDSTITTTSRANPADWVQPASKTAPLATPAIAGAYPIVGTTNFLGYTCYAGADATGLGVDRGTKLNNFLAYYVGSPVVNSPAPTAKGIQPANGFASLPLIWKNAVKETFITDTTGGTPTGARLHLNLWVGPLGPINKVLTSGKPKLVLEENPTCSATGVVGG